MVLVVELTLTDGRTVGLEAGDQITIVAVGDEYGGRWCCLSKTSNSLYVKQFFLGAPSESDVSIGKSVSFKCADIVEIKDARSEK